MALNIQGLIIGVAQFTWFVPKADPPQQAIVSDKPWESRLTTLATILLVLVLGTAVLWRSLQDSHPHSIQ